MGIPIESIAPLKINIANGIESEYQHGQKNFHYQSGKKIFVTTTTKYMN